MSKKAKNKAKNKLAVIPTASKPKIKAKPVPKKGSALKLEVMRQPFEPFVHFSRNASEKIKYIVDETPTEVGWIGLVEHIGEMLFIVDICLAEQEVSGTECTISEEGMAAAQEKLFDNNTANPEAYIGYWGHSHVNMGVTPSETDIVTAMQHYDKNNPHIFVATIHNKKGEIRSDIYDFDTCIIYDDVSYSVDPILDYQTTKELDDDLEEFLSKKVYTPVRPAYVSSAGVNGSNITWRNGTWNSITKQYELSLPPINQRSINESGTSSTIMSLQEAIEEEEMWEAAEQRRRSGADYLYSGDECPFTGLTYQEIIEADLEEEARLAMTLATDTDEHTVVNDDEGAIDVPSLPVG